MFTHLLKHLAYPPQGVELTEYGVLVVETGSGPRTESPTNAQLFCAFYYPPLFNISGAAFVLFRHLSPLYRGPKFSPCCAFGEHC